MKTLLKIAAIAMIGATLVALLAAAVLYVVYVDPTGLH